ncbi:MAG: type II toxin-antitoxin system HicB family antitoxin [Firmicutes bacterium]|nr:type II toxin-antitoxin system HicB family antitoxin [Bacillota bacterium]
MEPRYLVVIERANGNYSAYVPDVPGCVATGRTPEETYHRIAEALAMHLKGLEEDGLPIPMPQARAEYVSPAEPGR